jgi:flagella basal body P-ring formation protein FlgA
MENGRVGDFITVMNVVSGKRVRAKVIDENNVEISL